MRIVIDLQCCQNASRVRGIGRYALAMTRALIEAGPGHEWRVFLSDRFPETIAPIRIAFADLLPPEAILVCALPERIASADPANAWRARAAEVARGAYLASLAPDLVFVPSLFEGFHEDVAVSLDTPGFRTAVTVHDFIPLQEPWRYLPTRADEAAYARKVQELRGADLLLAISSYTAACVSGWLSVDPARVVVAHNGVEARFAPHAVDPASAETIARRLGITRPFVFNTSPLEHRKNVEGLIAAFTRLPPSLRDAHQLVIAGRMTPAGRERLDALVRWSGLAANALVLPGYVDEMELVALYAQCAAFTFPSFSEGFGLPVLEAMACGAPVIAARATALPEVVGREDALVDPASPNELTAALERVLTDVAWRAELREHGLARARLFSWERAARTALVAFEQLEAVTAPPRPAALPRVALVLPEGDRLAAGKAAVLAGALAQAMILVAVGDSPVAELWLDAAVERRDLAWFDRHAAIFDAVVYLVAGHVEPGIAERMAVHPGLMIRCRNSADDVPAWPLDGASTAHGMTFVEGEGEEPDVLPLLPIAPSRTAAAALRARLNLAPAVPLVVGFAADSQALALLGGRLEAARSDRAAFGVTLHTPQLIEDAYCALLSAADLIVLAGDLPSRWSAQIEVDSRHLGVEVVHVEESEEPLRQALTHRMAEPGRMRPVWARDDDPDLAIWVDRLGEAVREWFSRQPTLLVRTARGLPADVRGVVPSADDLASLARTIAINAGAGQP